jgi:hypothetical protein
MTFNIHQLIRGQVEEGEDEDEITEGGQGEENT